MLKALNAGKPNDPQCVPRRKSAKKYRVGLISDESVPAVSACLF